MQAQAPADYKLEIAPYTLDLSSKRSIRTLAYNGQVPGPVLRLKEGRPVTIDVHNATKDPEIVHWHGLFLPSEVDGSMEEGTPHIAPGATARYTFTPRPAGFRWYHTHVMAGHNFKRGMYTGLHGFLLIEGTDNPGRYDQEFFLSLHDWNPYTTGGDDGFMNPAYSQSAINGKILGSGDPLRVKNGQRVLLHILNSSPTEVHWVALSGHHFQVVALDGNPVPTPCTVSMLRLAPAERVDAIVEMNNPGVWILGEVRKSIQAAGMGIVVEYADRTGTPQWEQPNKLQWSYQQFASSDVRASNADAITTIPLVFESKFAGHGDFDHWMINGKSYPDAESPQLVHGQRYRLRFENRSIDDHPVHLHRHSFEITSLPGGMPTRGLVKDVVLVPASQQMEVEFTASNPGNTLFHCHQQDHMDMGFMMLFRYA
jgi:FtsP/CotA-like multicopper oxidase with cupredoxin domain